MMRLIFTMREKYQEMPVFSARIHEGQPLSGPFGT